jgi:hypothetical protein
MLFLAKISLIHHLFNKKRCLIEIETPVLLDFLGGVLKSMLTLNEAIIDVKEG